MLGTIIKIYFHRIEEVIEVDIDAKDCIQMDYDIGAMLWSFCLKNCCLISGAHENKLGISTEFIVEMIKFLLYDIDNTDNTDIV